MLAEFSPGVCADLPSISRVDQSVLAVFSTGVCAGVSSLRMWTDQCLQCSALGSVVVSQVLVD